jgi:hypothetical protein
MFRAIYLSLGILPCYSTPVEPPTVLCCYHHHDLALFYDTLILQPPMDYGTKCTEDSYLHVCVKFQCCVLQKSAAE